MSASGSVRVADHTACTARDSLLQLEGIHDAELVERDLGLGEPASDHAQRLRPVRRPARKYPPVSAARSLCGLAGKIAQDNQFNELRDPPLERRRTLSPWA